MAHALHDGCSDLIYVMLPVWQAQFGLSYAALATLRGLYAGTLAGLQIPAGHLVGRFCSGRTLLVLGTLLTALGYCLAGFSGGLTGLIASLALAGAGASTQHPQASAAISRAYGEKARGPLGTYNFAGDIGKSALPAVTSLLLTWLAWRHVLWLLAGLGLVSALALRLLLPDGQTDEKPAEKKTASPSHQGRIGFYMLLAIGILDSGVRMGLLTFLPFLLTQKGAPLPSIGLGLAMVFLGGAAGKFACGWLGARIGVLWTVLATEGATTLLILGILWLPLTPAMVLLPLLGVMLNGTSSVLYGTVPELTGPDAVERGFSIFYTGTIGSGALSPIAFGLLGDTLGVNGATFGVALTALLTYPLAIILAPRLVKG